MLVFPLHSVFMIHLCLLHVSSLVRHPLLLLSLSLSLYVLFPLSLPVSLALSLRLQDYRAEGQSRCALDYEAEISLQSSCPAQFMKGGGARGQM